MSLVPHEGVHSVTLRESFYEVVLVMPDALGEVGCYSYVECAVAFVGEDVDVGLFHCVILLDSGLVSGYGDYRQSMRGGLAAPLTAPLDSRFRRNDELGGRE